MGTMVHKNYPDAKFHPDIACPDALAALAWALARPHQPVRHHQHHAKPAKIYVGGRNASGAAAR